MPRHHSGFTLLEICLALALALLLILVAVPSLRGLLAEQQLKKSFDRLETLVSTARERSVTTQTPLVLTWNRSGITLKPVGKNEAEERLEFEKDEIFELRRPAALVKNAPQEWVFWQNGTCEPVVIDYRGPVGHWRVAYDGLTAQGSFLESSVQ